MVTAKRGLGNELKNKRNEGNMFEVISSIFFNILHFCSPIVEFLSDFEFLLVFLVKLWGFQNFEGVLTKIDLPPE